MISTWFAKFKAKKPEEEETTKASVKSANPEEFVKTDAARTFIKKWAAKIDPKTKEPLYAKFAITELLQNYHQIPGLDTDKKVLKAADRLLKNLKGLDQLQGFLAGLKAAPHGIMKILKKAA